jgi:hypothetical protein
MAARGTRYLAHHRTAATGQAAVTDHQRLKRRGLFRESAAMPEDSGTTHFSTSATRWRRLRARR